MTLLIVIAAFFVHFAGTNEAEEAMALIANSGGEEQMILFSRWAAAGKIEAPQTVDGERKIEGVAQLTNECAAGKITGFR